MITFLIIPYHTKPNNTLPIYIPISINISIVYTCMLWGPCLATPVLNKISSHLCIVRARSHKTFMTPFRMQNEASDPTVSGNLQHNVSIFHQLKCQLIAHNLKAPLKERKK